MAGQVEAAGPVTLVEEAAHLLRRASFETLLCHWIGSVPFAVALLVFWTQVSHPPLSGPAAAAESLGMALLLIWMNSWRSVFAGRLYRELSGAADAPWTRARTWRLIASQAFLGATKLVMLPIALLAVFPLANVIAFYRNASVLADREEMDPFGLIAKARHIAGRGTVQCWLLQFLLILLGLAAMLNVALTLIILPQLIKMVTGYESAFTRGGAQYFANRLFFLFVLAATWLLFDPFVQAVHCVRCFEGESVETGEDLRARLRRIRSGAARGAVAAAAVALLLVPPPARAADAVNSGELERAVRQTMQAPEYNWRIPPPPEAESNTPWIVRATDRAIKAVQAAVEWAGNKVNRFLRWIFGGLRISPMPGAGAAPARALHWSVWALLGLAAAVAAWVVWRSRSMRRKKAGPATQARAPAVRLEDEGLTADRLPEAGWLEMAERCLAEGNLRLALRAFYLANLAWLGRQEYLTIDAARTNREFELELRRKARQSPEARELFADNVRAFERAWYGLHEVLLDDAQAFRQRGDRIKLLLQPEAAV
jgi:hypothetical protein